VTGALAKLQLARAQVLTHDANSARKTYEDFLALWKDTDPDIPIYREAKTEYAQLRKRLT
jgi:eukaryotic-like serine/threonine-protein kinase